MAIETKTVERDEAGIRLDRWFKLHYPGLGFGHLQKLIRSIPKPVIAAVAGWAIGGGHVLHVVCDLTIAAENARFGQTGPKVGSFDGGFGASYLARIVGQKKAREIWYLCDQYDAREALEMGLVNKVVPLEQLEETYVAWAQKIIAKSPLAIRMLKSSFNAELDGQAGIQELAGNATLLYYLSEEAKEGKNAFVEKREIGEEGGDRRGRWRISFLRVTRELLRWTSESVRPCCWLRGRRRWRDARWRERTRPAARPGLRLLLQPGTRLRVRGRLGDHEPAGRDGAFACC